MLCSQQRKKKKHFSALPLCLIAERRSCVWKLLSAHLRLLKTSHHFSAPCSSEFNMWPWWGSPTTPCHSIHPLCYFHHHSPSKHPRRCPLDSLLRAPSVWIQPLAGAMPGSSGLGREFMKLICLCAPEVAMETEWEKGLKSSRKPKIQPHTLTSWLWFQQGRLGAKMSQKWRGNKGTWHFCPKRAPATQDLCVWMHMACNLHKTGGVSPSHLSSCHICLASAVLIHSNAQHSAFIFSRAFYRYQLKKINKCSEDVDIGYSEGSWWACSAMGWGKLFVLQVPPVRCFWLVKRWRTANHLPSSDVLPQ